MTNSLESQEWYEAMIEECRDLITEGVFLARWTVLKMYHALGRRILEEEKNFAQLGLTPADSVQRVAQSLGKSRRTLQYAVQFAREYPKIDALPGGKNISWHKVCNKVLAGKDPDEKCEHKKMELVHICCDCHQRIR